MAGSSGKRALPRDSSGSLGAPARKAWDGGGLQTARPGPPRLGRREVSAGAGRKTTLSGLLRAPTQMRRSLPDGVAAFPTRAVQPEAAEETGPRGRRSRRRGFLHTSPQPLPASGSPAAWLTAQRSALCQTTRPSCKTGALHPSFYSADREQTKPKDTPSHDSRACRDTDHTHVPSWQRKRKTVPHEGQPVPTSSRCYCF